MKNDHASLPRDRGTCESTSLALQHNLLTCMHSTPQPSAMDSEIGANDALRASSPGSEKSDFSATPEMGVVSGSHTHHCCLARGDRKGL